MAVALRGSAVTPNGNPTTGFSVNIPSAVETDDLLFMAVTSRDSVNPVLGPFINDDDTGGNAWAILSQSSDGKATVWWKRATSGTASKTVTISSCLGSASGVLKCYSEASLEATPYSNVVQESNASGDESHAGFTPDRASSMLCATVHNYANDNAVTSLSFATAGATTATEKLSTGGSDCGCIFGHVFDPGAATASGTLTWAQTNGTTYSITWAIKPRDMTPSVAAGTAVNNGALALVLAMTPSPAEGVASTSASFAAVHEMTPDVAAGAATVTAVQSVTRGLVGVSADGVATVDAILDLVGSGPTIQDIFPDTAAGTSTVSAGLAEVVSMDATAAVGVATVSTQLSVLEGLIPGSANGQAVVTAEAASIRAFVSNTAVGAANVSAVLRLANEVTSITPIFIFDD